MAPVAGAVTGDLTCGVDVKVGGLVGDVARGIESHTLGRDLAGVSQGLLHTHLKRTLGNLLACEQHRYLGDTSNT